MNALSYLPVGGIYTGTKKIQAALTSIKLQKMTENPQKYSTYNHTRIVRGVVEILGAGSLFLIPDVIASLSRSAARVSRQFAQAIAMSG